MEREVLRAVAFLAVLLFFVGDFASLVSPMLQSLGVAPEQGGKAPATKPDLGDDSPGYDQKAAIDVLATSPVSKSTLMATIRNSCLPKLICELNATPHREKLTESERSLLGLIRDTSISTTAEVTSKYHFAAHMGQLIAGVEGTGCHNFYPGCPFPGLQVLQMMKKVKIR